MHEHDMRAQSESRMRPAPVRPSVTPESTPLTAKIAALASGLCGAFRFTARDRERMLDMERYAGRSRAGFVAVAALAAVASVGLDAVPFLIAFGVLLRGAAVGSRRSERPERWLGGSWLAGFGLTGVLLAGTGGMRSPFVVWLLIPAAGLALRLGRAGVILGVAGTIMTVLVVAATVPARAALGGAAVIIAPVGAVMLVGMALDAVLRSDVQYRAEAVLDPLTALLNRSALESRARDLAAQSTRTGDPVGVILGDLDHFKELNDTHGHQFGDAVLVQVAYTLRKELRAYELAYRLGGEEFLILLPGADDKMATTIAESLRRAIGAINLQGVPLTISFGVGASKRGQAFDLATVLASADAALYRAKAAGRNLVVAACASVGEDAETPSNSPRTARDY